MSEYLHRGHTVTDIKYHFVWATKYRYAVLRGEIATRARDIVRQVCEAKEMTIIKGVVSGDHVHVLVSVPPHLAPAQIMQWVKGRSSRRLQQEFSELRRRYWGQHLWARGYFCACAGTVTDDLIKEYLDRHHGRSPDPDFRVEVPE
jgi:putative transposase